MEPCQTHDGMTRSPDGVGMVESGEIVCRVHARAYWVCAEVRAAALEQENARLAQDYALASLERKQACDERDRLAKEMARREELGRVNEVEFPEEDIFAAMTTDLETAKQHLRVHRSVIREKVASLLDVEKERDQARAEVERLNKERSAFGEPNCLSHPKVELVAVCRDCQSEQNKEAVEGQEWKRRAEAAEKELEITKRSWEAVCAERNEALRAADERDQARAEVERLTEALRLETLAKNVAESEVGEKIVRSAVVLTLQRRAEAVEKLLATLMARHLMHCQCDDCVSARALLRDGKRGGE